MESEDRPQACRTRTTNSHKDVRSRYCFWPAIGVIEVTVEAKRCTGCNRNLSLDHFPSDASKSDGRHTRRRGRKRARSKQMRAGAVAARQRKLREARQQALERLAERHDAEFLK